MQLLGRVAPAATCYAIASSASQGVTVGRRFWDPVTKKLGIDISSNNDREKLSLLYSKTCQKLGVMVPDVSKLAWTNIAPMMAQASILHAWSGPLVTGLHRTLAKHPAPDTNDDVALKRFSKQLASSIHGVRNLTKILATEVGSMVTHRIVSSLIYDKFDLLPHHLIEPLKKAFTEKGSAVHLKSPYISFSEAYSELEIILPKQLNKLLKYTSYWQIGNRQLSPNEENRIEQSNLTGEVVSIELRDLDRDYPDQDFTIDLSMPNGFMLFDQKTGREKSIKAGQRNELTHGEYTLVMKPSVTTNDDGYVEEIGKYRLLKDIYIHPGSGEWEVYVDGETTIISASLMTGIYIPRDREEAILLNDGMSLYYGDSLEINAIVPKRQHAGELSIEIKANDNDAITTQVELKSYDSGEYDYSEELIAAAKEICASLSPGIHKLEFKISTNSAAATKGIWYWKGLNYISDQKGFICEDRPENIDFKKTRGIRLKGVDCVFEKNFRAPEVIVYLKNSDQFINIPRPGVQATLISSEDQWSDELTSRSTITIGGEEKRLIRIKSGGFSSWDIFCNKFKINTLTRDKSSLVLGLSTLVAQYGDSGSVSAINKVDGEQMILFSYASDLISSPLTQTTNHGLKQIVWKTYIPLPKIGQLAVKISDYTNSPVADSPMIFNLTIDLLSEENPLVELDITDVLSAVLKWKKPTSKGPAAVALSLTVSDSMLSNEFQFVEIIYKPIEAESWLNLECKEAVNTSPLCFIISGSENIDDTPTWWKHLCRISSNHNDENSLHDHLYSNMPDSELKQGLATISKIVGTKFPTASFRYNAKYFTALDHRLAERRKKAGQLDAKHWWDQHAADLENQCKGNNKLATRPFIISSHVSVFDSPINLDLDSNTQNFTEECLNFSSTISATGGHLEFAKQELITAPPHLMYLYQSFKNFNEVAGRGTQSEFKDFQFNSFLEAEYKRAMDHESAVTELTDIPPLSARHLLLATKQLKRRARILKQVTEGEADHVLGERVRRISELHRKLKNKDWMLYQGINYTPIKKPSTDKYSDSFDTQFFPNWPGLPSSCIDHQDKAAQIADICWSLACITRSKANGTLSEKSYTTLIELFKSRNAMESPLNLIFTFAPELYVYHVALIDFALLKK